MIAAIRAIRRAVYCDRVGHNVWRFGILRVCWGCRDQPHPEPPPPTDWTTATVYEPLLGSDVIIVDDPPGPSTRLGSVPGLAKPSGIDGRFPDDPRSVTRAEFGAADLPEPWRTRARAVEDEVTDLLHRPPPIDRDGPDPIVFGGWNPR